MNEPPTKRSRPERESKGSMALAMTGGTDASDDKELDVDDAEDDGQAGARDNWLDLDGCRTIEDVRRVVHARFRTSQQLLDYIQAYKVSLVLFIPRKPCKSTQTLQVNAANCVCFLYSLRCSPIPFPLSPSFSGHPAAENHPLANAAAAEQAHARLQPRRCAQPRLFLQKHPCLDWRRRLSERGHPRFPQLRRHISASARRVRHADS
jgi:hypothetical protein